MAPLSAAEALSGPFLAIIVVLAAAGILKVRTPEPAARALAAAALPSGRRLVRALGVVEVAVAVTSVVASDPLGPALVAAMYLIFASYGGLAAIRGDEVSCGCFGEDRGSPVVPIHLGLTIGAAGVAAATAFTRTTPINVLGDQPLRGVPLVGLVGVCAYIMYLALAALPELAAAVKGVVTPNIA